MSPTDRVVDKAVRRAGTREMVIGGVVFVIGVAVTVGSYLFPDDVGQGRFIIAYGAIIIGALQFGYGLILSRQA